MKLEDFLDYMKRTVEGWKESGQYLPLTMQHNNFLITLESFRDFAKQCDEGKRMMHELLIEFSKSSLRSILLINTGGVFVVMTMLSGLLSRETRYSKLIPEVASEAIYFVLGVAFAVISVGLSYLSQWLYTNRHDEKYGLIMNVVAILSGAISFLLFIAGAIALRSVLMEIAC